MTSERISCRRVEVLLWTGSGINGPVWLKVELTARIRSGRRFGLPAEGRYLSRTARWTAPVIAKPGPGSLTSITRPHAAHMIHWSDTSAVACGRGVRRVMHSAVVELHPRRNANLREEPYVSMARASERAGPAGVSTGGSGGIHRWQVCSRWWPSKSPPRVYSFSPSSFPRVNSPG
jgi:hypothetical protein